MLLRVFAALTILSWWRPPHVRRSCVGSVELSGVAGMGVAAVRVCEQGVLNGCGTMPDLAHALSSQSNTRVDV